jgi:Streptomyces sporulation and cell division protein, SsgA
MRQTTVVEELSLHLVIAGQPSVPMAAELRYDTGDPYAVHATFRADDSQVTWVLARELLMTGLQAASGLGDVQVMPCEEHPESVVLIKLSSPDGVAVLAANAADLRGFLLRTCDQVPPGAEAEFLELDIKLAQLLA